MALVLPQRLAAEPAIRQLSAKAANGKVSVAFHLEGAFESEEIQKGLRSGLPTAFTYTVELTRKRPNWFDQTVAETRIDVICTFNSVTQEFLLNYRRDRRLVRSETLSDIETLRARMTRIEEGELFDHGLWRPQKLAVRVRAHALPGYLSSLLPWNSTTDWKETRVKTAKAIRP